jgi:hypothetical protein
MTEAVPLRATLQRHHHHVVGGADAALIEHAGIGIGAGAQHSVQRIDAAERRIRGFAALRAVIVEIERERDHLALFHQLRGGDDVLGLRVIERGRSRYLDPICPSSCISPPPCGDRLASLCARTLAFAAPLCCVMDLTNFSRMLAQNAARC